MGRTYIRQSGEPAKKETEERIMKKLLSLVLVTVLLALSLAACGKGSEKKTIKVGASPTPHAEILKVIKDDLAAEGYTLEIVEFQDYVLPNTSLEDGDLDANYFQHRPYLDDFNKENGTHIVPVAAIHYEPFGIYPGKKASLADLAEGDQVAVPNDTTNEARALLLLEQEGLITLKADAGMTAKKTDIESYNVGIEIVELEAAQLGRSLQDVAAAVINGNYAMDAGLSVGKDAIAVEAQDSLAAKTYGNVLCVKEGNENDEGIKALVKALTSDKVKDYINSTFDGAVVECFDTDLK